MKWIISSWVVPLSKQRPEEKKQNIKNILERSYLRSRNLYVKKYYIPFLNKFTIHYLSMILSVIVKLYAQSIYSYKL